MNLIKVLALSFPATANFNTRKVKTFNMYVALSGNDMILMN